MKELSVSDMFANRTSRYPLVIAVARRAREITDQINRDEEIVETKAVNMAIDEFKNHKYIIIDNE